MRGQARTNWWGVVLEAPDGAALARFDADLLGWPIAKQDNDGAAIAVPGTSSYLAFQSSPDYVPPVWPSVGGQQQMMMHIDVAVDDLGTAVAAAVELGATPAGFQPQEDVRVGDGAHAASDRGDAARHEALVAYKVHVYRGLADRSRSEARWARRGIAMEAAPAAIFTCSIL